MVEIDVPIAPAVIRTKLDRPAAAAIRSGVMPDSVSVVSGMKKKASAPPCRMVGTMMAARSVSVVNLERMNSTIANTTNAKLAIARGSHVDTLRPTTGDSRIASTPTGASAKPAAVAV